MRCGRAGRGDRFQLSARPARPIGPTRL